MALSRVHTWVAGEVLTASDLNAEFDNIINNTTLLISPLTSNLDFAGFSLIGLARGSASSPGLAITGDTNTGLWSPGADQLSLSAGGATAFSVVGRVAGTAYVEFKRDGSIGERFYPVIAFGGTDDGVMSITAGTIDVIASGRRVLQASAYTNATNYLRFSPRDTGAGPLIDVAGGDTNIDLNLGAKGSGIIKAATAFQPAALASNPPPQYGLVRANTPAAWAVFHGASASIYASFGVSSIVRSSEGTYTVTWSRAFKQASAYAVIGSASVESEALYFHLGTGTSGGGPTATTCVVRTANSTPALRDPQIVTFMAFGDHHA